MANKTYAVHTSESNIERIDQWAEKLRRSRNSIINEAIEMVLEHYDAGNPHLPLPGRTAQMTTRKKAGAR
jgi:metal-responsive CopG/Arc/MetJ family transcriptional regulator